MAEMVKLKSLDGIILSVELKVAKISPGIKIILEGYEARPVKGSEPPIVPVDAKILQLCLEWCAHHIDDAPATGSLLPNNNNEGDEISTDNISEWDKDFLLKLDPSTLFDLISAAEKLLIIDLGINASKILHNRITEMTPEEKLKTFKTENDRKRDFKETEKLKFPEEK